jgi:6-phosphogluconate dehydrogenase
MAGDGKADLGVVGLAVMGANLARNAARHGFGVALFNRHAARTDALMRDHGGEGRFYPANSLGEFVAALSRPRIVIVMVKAGKPVDDMIDELLPLLDRGDILIDAGNSLFTDSARRAEALRLKGVEFVGMGVSGGEQGALEGPSMMPGCEPAAYARIAPFLDKMAAQAGGRACCACIGSGGAGHYVKMVHNGIEYADMQLIAEAYDILTSVYGLSAAAIADVFAAWNATELESYLIEITAIVLRKRDATGGALVDAILDEAEQKGTGRWTAQSALDLGVPVTAITEAVYARALSARRDLRLLASQAYPRRAPAPLAPAPAGLEAIRHALYAAKIVSYAQGFEMMSAASELYGWKLNLGEIAAIWRGGCIIRARMLDRILQAYAAAPPPAHLLLADDFRDAVVAADADWRRVVALAVERGVATPAFSSTLAYYDGLRRARGPANLLQGLRDYFGAHTYRRLDKPGVFHTRWGQDGEEVAAG